jgi:hypothetical protein
LLSNGKISLGTIKYIWKENIKLDYKEIWYQTLSGSGYGAVAVSCEDNNEPSVP